MKHPLILAAFLAASVAAFGQPGPGPTPSPWTVNGSATYKATGQVGIGTSSPNAGNALTVKATGSAAPLNIVPGSVPASPNNGDLWNTSSGVFTKIGGSIVQVNPNFQPPFDPGNGGVFWPRGYVTIVGDSLIQGVTTPTIGTTLANYFGGSRTIQTHYSTGGLGTGGICVNLGACPQTVTVVGGSIPSGTTPVQITFTNPVYIPVNQNTTANVAAAISGVYGFVSYNSGTSLVYFTRQTAGSSVSVTTSPLIVDVTQQNTGTVCMEGGYNNFTTPVEVLADYAAFVAEMTNIGNQNWCIIDIVTSPVTPIGSSAYTSITTLNSQLQTLYGAHVIHWQEWLTSNASLTAAGIGPSSPNWTQDQSDIADGYTPFDLRFDNSSPHLNGLGDTVSGAFFGQFLSSNVDTLNPYVPTLPDVTALFTAPPPTGSVAPNTGNFTSLSAQNGFLARGNIVGGGYGSQFDLSTAADSNGNMTLSPSAGLFLNWAGGGTRTNFGSGASAVVGYVDSGGNMNLNGAAVLGGNATLSSILGGGTGAPFEITARSTSNGAITVNPYGSGIIYLNRNSGTGGLRFGDGAGGVVGSVDSAGNAVFNGSVTATSFSGSVATATNLAGGTAGSTPYQSAAGTTAFLVPTATAGQMFRSGASAAPTWSTATFPATAGTTGNVLRSNGTNFLSATLAASDLSNGTNGTGAVALTTNTTFVTPTLGTASGTSLTLSGLTSGQVTYAGTAGILSGDSGFTYNSSTHALTATTFVGALTGTASGNLTSAANSITLGNVAQIGANTMLGNWSGSTANIAAQSMPSCADTSGNHLNYVNGTGITCGTSSSYSLPTATSSVLGGVKPDGTTLSNTAGAISVNLASANTWSSGTIFSASGQALQTTNGRTSLTDTGSAFAGPNLFNLYSSSGAFAYLTDGVVGVANYGGLIKGYSVALNGGYLGLGTKNAGAYTETITIDPAGGTTFHGTIASNANVGVSCAANTVVLLTQVVSNGLVTHC